MHENTSTGVESVLYELVAGREVFEQIVILHIIDFHNFMLQVCKQLIVQGQSQNREYMRYAAV